MGASSAMSAVIAASSTPISLVEPPRTSITRNGTVSNVVYITRFVSITTLVAAAKLRRRNSAQAATWSPRAALVQDQRHDGQDRPSRERTVQQIDRAKA